MTHEKQFKIKSKINLKYLQILLLIDWYAFEGVALAIQRAMKIKKKKTIMIQSKKRKEKIKQKMIKNLNKLWFKRIENLPLKRHQAKKK